MVGGTNARLSRADRADPLSQLMAQAVRHYTMASVHLLECEIGARIWSLYVIEMCIRFCYLALEPP
jgi:hypothetical protein